MRSNTFIVPYQHINRYVVTFITPLGVNKCDAIGRMSLRIPRDIDFKKIEVIEIDILPLLEICNVAPDLQLDVEPSNTEAKSLLDGILNVKDNGDKDEEWIGFVRTTLVKVLISAQGAYVGFLLANDRGYRAFGKFYSWAGYDGHIYEYAGVSLA